MGFDPTAQDFRVMSRWQNLANERSKQIVTEVLEYEDLLQRPDVFIRNVARILKVHTVPASLVTSFINKIQHRTELSYADTAKGKVLLPVHLSLYSVNMINIAGRVLREEFASWTSCEQ